MLSTILFLACALFPAQQPISFSQTTVESVSPMYGGPIVIVEETDYVRYSPNPSTDSYITATSTNTERPIQSIKVFDLNGTLVFIQNVNSISVELNFSELEAGKYIIEATTSVHTSHGLMIIGL